MEGSEWVEEVRRWGQVKVIAGGDLTLTMHIWETLSMSHHSGLRSGGVHNWCCPWIYSTTAGAGFDLLQVLPLELLHGAAREPPSAGRWYHCTTMSCWRYYPFLSPHRVAIFIKYHNTFPLFNSITFPSSKHRNRVLRLAASPFILETKTTDIACALDSCFSGHFGGLPSKTSRSRAVPSCPPGLALPCGRGCREWVRWLG